MRQQDKRLEQDKDILKQEQEKLMKLKLRKFPDHEKPLDNEQPAALD